MKRGHFIFLVVLFSISCLRPEASPTIDPPCSIDWDSFSEPADNSVASITCGCPLGCVTYYPDPIVYGDPFFHPNEPHLIGYMRAGISCNEDLWIYDLCSQEASFVTNGVCYGPDWSRKDWIIFTGTNRQLWKIKSNGDSLTQLTFDGDYNNLAKWNPIGDEFIFWKTVGSTGYLIRADENGVSLDTIDDLFGIQVWQWPTPDTIIGYSGPGVDGGPIYYVISTQGLKQIEHINHFAPGSSHDSLILSVHFLQKENAILWQTPAFIAKTSLITGERTYLQTGGGISKNRWYHNTALSPDKRFLILEREDRDQLGIGNSCPLNAWRKLYAIDIDGSNERKLLLPE